MSCYEWERAEISVPIAHWAGLKAALRAVHDERQAAAHALALRVHEALTSMAAGTRGFDWRAGAQAALRQLGVSPDDGWPVVLAMFSPNERKVDPARPHAQAVDIRGAAGRPPRPRASLFPKSTSKTTVFDVDRGGAGIRLDDSSRTVHWHVSDNNHAVRRARADPLAAALFRQLAAVVWTKGTGGFVVGGDAHHGDRHEGHGGPSRIVHRYGLLDDEPETRMRPSGGGFGAFGSRRW